MIPTLVAGTGVNGSLPNMLTNPHGIFVNPTLDLYVADSGNDRVQMFSHGDSNAMTVAGNGASGTISLNHPQAVVLDALDVLFIADTMSHRIVASGSSGFRCIIGCGGTSGSAPNELNTPVSMSFDRDGNLFVVDQGNARIQQFGMNVVACRKFMKYSTRSIARSILSRSRDFLQPSSIVSLRDVGSERGHHRRQ